MAMEYLRVIRKTNGKKMAIVRQRGDWEEERVLFLRHLGSMTVWPLFLFYFCYNAGSDSKF